MPWEVYVNFWHHTSFENYGSIFFLSILSGKFHKDQDLPLNPDLIFAEVKHLYVSLGRMNAGNTKLCTFVEIYMVKKLSKKHLVKFSKWPRNSKWRLRQVFFFCFFKPIKFSFPFLLNFKVWKTLYMSFGKLILENYDSRDRREPL